MTDKSPRIITVQSMVRLEAGAPDGSWRESQGVFQAVAFL